MSKVLVTGGSGFVASHTIARLLAAGHEVRATVRRQARVDGLRDMLGKAGVDAHRRLSFFEAHLEKDSGWTEAMTGCQYVLHMASPFPHGNPEHEDDLIVPARDGTLRVLRAARVAGVERVVLTSSFAAIGYGHRTMPAVLDESMWTQLDEHTSAYVKSKTIAERAAWEFMANEGVGLELAVINPVGVFGPVLGADYSSSIALIKQMMEGGIAACPQIYFGVVDVRDLADLHILAMEDPAAHGQRFLASAGDCLSMLQVAQILKARLGHRADRVPTRELPNWLVRIAGIWNDAARQVRPELGRVKHLTNEKARSRLGWLPRTSEEAVTSTAESLIRFGLLGAHEPGIGGEAFGEEIEKGTDRRDHAPPRRKHGVYDTGPGAQ